MLSMDESKIELEILLAEKIAEEKRVTIPGRGKQALQRQIGALQFALELFRE